MTRPLAHVRKTTWYVGTEFHRLEAAWLKGLSTIAESGVRLIVDEVFLDGVLSQERLRQSLAGRTIAWVGVTCDVDVATQRERDRGDRVVGGSEKQSRRVHEGVLYDLVVDTSSHTSDEVARQIADHIHAASA